MQQGKFYGNNCFGHWLTRDIYSKWEWICRNRERFLFVRYKYTINSLRFYTGISFGENRSCIQGEMFQIFKILYESSNSKAYSKELGGNMDKWIHGFCQEHGQLQKNISYITQISPFEVFMRSSESYFSTIRLMLKNNSRLS